MSLQVDLTRKHISRTPTRKQCSGVLCRRAPLSSARPSFDTIILCVFFLCSLVAFHLNRSGWACYVSSWFCILIFTFSLEACVV
jgi:hypothetical protein